MKKSSIFLHILKFIQDNLLNKEILGILILYLVLMITVQCNKKEEEPITFFWPDSLPGKLIYSNNGIWTIDSHGFTRLIYKELDTLLLAPKWSPDDSKFICTYTYPNHDPLFYTYHWELCVINSDGKGIHLLNVGGDDPCWSRDGTDIIFFISDSFSDSTDMYKMDINDTVSQIFKSIPLCGGGFDLSPDGNLVIFTTLMPIDGKEGLIQFNLSEDSYEMLAEGWAGSPEFSPDGSKIVYSYKEAMSFEKLYDIWVMNADGTDKINLTNYSDSNYHWGGVNPTWSPDGKMIAFFTNAQAA